METIEILQNAWFFIIGFLFIGYAVLDGFDLGIAVLMPALAKKNSERQQVMDAIWPFWDGNEVWIITAGASLFAAFPHTYATVFSGFYLALMLVLFALIFRAVSMEFWYYDEKRKHIWSWAFVVGSLVPSILYGVALGNLLVGIPIDNSMNYGGTFFTLLRPYPLVIGILGLAAILLQGVTYAAHKTDGVVQERAQKLVNRILALYAIALVLSFIVTVIYLPQTLSKFPVWIAAIVTVGALSGVYMWSKNGFDRKAFMSSSLAFIGLWGIVGTTLYPNLARSTVNDAFNLTIYNSSSTQITLTAMTIIALIGMPLVILYSFYVYRIFKGKVSIKQ